MRKNIASLQEKKRKNDQGTSLIEVVPIILIILFIGVLVYSGLTEQVKQRSEGGGTNETSSPAPEAVPVPQHMKLHLYQ